MYNSQKSLTRVMNVVNLAINDRDRVDYDFARIMKIYSMYYRIINIQLSLYSKPFQKSKGL